MDFRSLPFLAWPRPSKALLARESVAGLSVGLMVIPQAIAYAVLAGMPLITGIYAALLPALVAVLFSASPRLSVGPTAITATLVSASLAGLAAPGSPAWVELAVWLSLLAGGLQVVLGFARLGWMLSLVSSPVLIGFTQAAALFIVLSQLPSLLGLSGGLSSLTSLQGWEPKSLLMGLASLGFLMLVRRWSPAFPSVLIVVLLSALLSSVLGWSAQGVPTVGAIPQGLPDIHIPGALSWNTYTHLMLPVLVITLVSFLETAACARVDNERAGKSWDQDQDLIGQGLAKVASGLCGSFPTSSSFSRSALNLFAGAKTGWATLFAVGVMLVFLQYLTPLLQPVPQSVLAAIVIAAVLGLVKPQSLTRIFKVNRMEASTALVTFLVTLLSAPYLYWGVLAGVVMTLVHFLSVRLHPRIVEVGLHPDGSLRDRHRWSLAPLASTVYAFRMDAALDFASAASFERAVVHAIHAQQDIRHVCLFAMSINRIDLTGTETMARVEKMLRERGIVLHICGMKRPVELVLQQAGCLVSHGLLRIYRTDQEAVSALRQHAFSPEH